MAMIESSVTQNGPWVIHKSEVVYQNPWATVTEDVITKNNLQGTFTTFRFGQTGDIVCVIPFDTITKKTYINHEFRYAYGDYILNPCAGNIDTGELPIDAVRRELQEEQGIIANNFVFLGVSLQGPSQVIGKAYLYLATDLVFTKTEHEDTEDIAVVEIDFSDLVAKALTDELPWATGNICILRAQKYLTEKGII
jgi:ADP-ribose pyrophosphatase